MKMSKKININLLIFALLLSVENSFGRKNNLHNAYFNLYYLKNNINKSDYDSLKKYLLREYNSTGILLKDYLLKFKPVSKRIESFSDDKNKTRGAKFKLLNADNEVMYVSYVIFKNINLPYSEKMKKGGNLFELTEIKFRN